MQRHKPNRMTLSATFKYLSVASLLTASASTYAQNNRQEAASPTGERFTDFLARVASTASPAAKQTLVDEYIRNVLSSGHTVIEDSVVHFLYSGNATRVSVASDLNGWNPSGDSMSRIEGTNLFHLAGTIDVAARFEYKLIVDSAWILDPLNKQQAIGGYGANSEIWMPQYKPPQEILYRKDIPHGRIDTLQFRSRFLGRTHYGFVYLPPGYRKSRTRYPSIYVTDGGEYLSLALMNNVLDNLIADGRIQPVIAIFIDPRTDIRNSATSMRMLDYAMSDSFVNFLIKEVRARILKTYRVKPSPAETAIMGASLGALISTYTAYQHPEVFGLSAAQSPAYWWKDSAILSLIETGPKKNIRFYLDTGTIRDAQEHARAMKAILQSKGYDLKYGEYPEGHNWVNWRARLDDILEYFWGKK